MSYQVYHLIVELWMFAGLLTFLYLLKVDAPFGRHTKAGWGPTVDNRIGWIIMEATVLVVLIVVMGLSPAWPGAVVWLMCGLFVAHYVHRSLIFPVFLRTPAKRMPLVIVCSAMGFNTMNGFLMGYYFGHFAQYSADWLTDPRFLTGTVVFVAGMVINIRSDYRLIALRRPGETGYRIPVGGLFEYVSCPNHLGEILEWTGFAILTWSLPGLAFAWWTFANLAPRSLAHHRWYRTQFEDYPEGRKALIPKLL